MQAYLEKHLKVATNITPELIQQLKVKWRKDYVSRYNSTYREDKVQITFRLSKQQYKTLVSIANEQELKPTVFCRHRIIDLINGSNDTNMQPLKLLLMELIDAIEQAQYEEVPLDTETIYTKTQEMLNLIV